MAVRGRGGRGGRVWQGVAGVADAPTNTCTVLYCPPDQKISALAFFPSF